MIEKYGDAYKGISVLCILLENHTAEIGILTIGFYCIFDAFAKIAQKK